MLVKGNGAVAGAVSTVAPAADVGADGAVAAGGRAAALHVTAPTRARKTAPVATRRPGP
jgi:hypothetical protein